MTKGAERGGGLTPEVRVVDAFTRDAFGGNPAAVVLPGPEWDPAKVSSELLGKIAREMNLSETAFPHHPDQEGVRRLRWFTPSTEVTLCGHATLAAAHALVEAGASLPLRFHSLSGVLEVHEGGDGALRLDFPLDPPVEMAPPPGLLMALGLDGVEGVRYATGRRCALVALPDEAREQLFTLEPDPQALGRVVLPAGVMGVSVTASGADGNSDFHSRFFGPWVGVQEDPVTGMAHCVLAPWWAEATGRSSLHATQGGDRQGALTVEVVGDRAHLVGHAVTLLEGRLRLPEQEGSGS